MIFDAKVIFDIMKKEISDILTAFKEAQQNGRQTALATVVHVEGSSYRRPGARMLVEDNGKMTGAISGGCLEGDALRKALLAINQQQNKLVTYNTLDEDDAHVGIQLGCNGIVHILFEPVDAGNPHNPVAMLQKCFGSRSDSVLVTLFSLNNFNNKQPGTCFFINEKNTWSKIDDKVLEAEIKENALSVLSSKSSSLKHCGSEEFTAFIELIQPAVSLIVVGAGNDSLPIVEMAKVLGWQITVIDGRATHANKQRFPKADKVIIAKPAEVIQQLVIDERTVFVLMTHNYNYDLEILKLLQNVSCSYIGILGPKARLKRMLSELQEQAINISDKQQAVIYGPTGLNIGAETAEEIALSVLSEIKAVLANQNGTFLRDRSEAIHSRLPVEITV